MCGVERHKGWWSFSRGLQTGNRHEELAQDSFLFFCFCCRQRNLLPPSALPACQVQVVRAKSCCHAFNCVNGQFTVKHNHQIFTPMTYSETEQEMRLILTHANGQTSKPLTAKNAWQCAANRVQQDSIVSCAFRTRVNKEIGHLRHKLTQVQVSLVYLFFVKLSLLYNH